MLQTEIAIVGTGLAGLTAALHLAPHKKVTLICKRALLDGASQWAQGGIAAVLDSADSHEQHIRDTLVAGAGLCDADATRFIVEHGREAIEWLINMGVPFTRDDSAFGFHLTREGGHAVRRIIHAADATGRAVQMTLEKRVREHPNITLLEDHMAIDLITVDGRCAGLYALETKTGQIITITAPATILATGGAGKVYLYTTNPDTATGDGIAMAWRAGCRVANMEFIQFHPTCLYHPHAKSYLISEAVRGEGGLLILPDGTRFMPAHDERAELAPRDVVARAIDFEMKRRGLDCVYLDISHRPPEFVREHFPNIAARCLELGIDITREPIPVVPAAHYTCGGVITDLAGRADLPGLYAVGETTCTGLHGANRLASNSLLECVVMARAAVNDILSHPPAPVLSLREWDESRVTAAEEEVVIAHNWDELRLLMWNYVGIVRSNLRLESAERRIKLIRGEVQGFYARYRVSRDLLELRNLVDVADLVVSSALARHESRGLHYSRDYPHTDAVALPTVLKNPRKLAS
jgi:L-aspartate oxidase